MSVTYIQKNVKEAAERRERTVKFLERLMEAAACGNLQGLFVIGYANSEDPEVEKDLYGCTEVATDGDTFTLLGLAEAQLSNVRNLAAAVLTDE